MRNVGKFLFVLGVVVMVVELLANIYNTVLLSHDHAVGLNWGSTIAVLFGSLAEGGTLMGLGKIIELLEQKR